ncbi:U-box domain-containing protein 33-like [Silene latifolia]|uniref:U-box domain-containing protein 33-like n=1 Tax=Silene latifolia TaxID=37657 RepID=UPI003D781F54
MGSRGESMVEPRREEIVDDKIFVAVGKEVKQSKSTLTWALHNSKGKKICIVYVHVPAKMIPMPMGGKFPADQVGERELKAFREKEQQEMINILDSYLKLCTQVVGRAEKVHIETDSTIEQGIVELISQQRIGILVMGAATDRSYSRKMVEPKSRKAIYVRNHAPDYCHIWFVCKGYLIYTREGVKHSILDNKEKLSNNPNSNQLDVLSPSQDLVSRSRFFDFDGNEGASEDYGHSSRVSFSQSSVHSTEVDSVLGSSRLSFVSSDAGEPGQELLVLPQSLDKNLSSSPPSVLESSINDHLYDQLEHAMIEAENARREAFEESMRRRKAEKEALDTICKAKKAERLYYEQLRLRKASQENLAKAKEELENTKNLWIKVSHELHETMDQKLSLETLIEESNSSVKELEDKLFSAVELLQKYKNERDELQIERDNALREAEKLRKQLDEGPSISHVPVFFSEFSFSDLEKATNYFDPSLKIGEGGYGSIYKGFLRHTEVAIKILNPGSMQGPQEFNQEVDVLSKLRHPNMVTLIGACPESWALVYEYLPGGSLEDRLVCKDNASPLPWQTRIRIATELCSVLIYLHSSRPSCIIHGDIKPANILLDHNFVSKLSDFGICRVVSNGETSMEQTRLFFTEPKGTFTYMDPEFLSSGELTPKSDVYSFGIILLRLLTGKSALGIAKEVEYALAKGTLDTLLDPSGGDWPFVQAEQLARMALRCCDKNRVNRPDLGSDVWRVLEPMKSSCQSLSMLRLESCNQAPTYFMCPIFQEIMEDPHIAADGFTYEAEAIRGWLDSGHDSSPMTNVKLANHNLIPNRALRSAIQEWLQPHPGA